MITQSIQQVTIKRITTLLESAITQLQPTWTDIGLSTEIQFFYCSKICHHVETLLNNVIKETAERKYELFKRVQKLMQDGHNLSKQLKIKIDTKEYHTLSLLELEKTFHKDIENLQCIRQQRIAAFEELTTKERKICTRLGIQSISTESIIPSEEELSTFKLYIEKQEEEKNRLECIFTNLREEIVQMMDDLEITPSENFERTVYNNPENFILSSSNISKLKELAIKLKKKSNEKAVENMKQELMILWNTLGQPSHSRSKLFDQKVEDHETMVKMINEEMERCRNQKRKNIAKFIEEARNELLTLWNLCKFEKSQRERFVPFNCNVYSEELLALHNLEIDKVRKIYEKNRPIFDLLDEREKLCKRMTELLLSANNPNRFQNRGGQLLAEERERKIIQKKLPKIEEQIRSLAKEYEIANKRAFTVNDLSLDEFLAKSAAPNTEKNFQRIKKK